jgi:hypothetical protein
VALSWDAMPDALRYRVNRTEYQTVTIPVPELPSLPDAAGLDPAVALSRRDGAMTQVTASVPGEAIEIAKTTATSFVDTGAKPGVSYTYDIVAEDSDGNVVGRTGITPIANTRPAPR